MNSFQGIDIKTPVGNIWLESGRGYGLEYKFSRNVEVERAAVHNGVLYVHCRASRPSATFHWNLAENYIRITYPAGTDLQDVKLESHSGEIETSGLRAQSFWTKSSFGSQRIKDVQANSITFQSCSGIVEAEALVANELNASFVSGGVQIAGGNFRKAEITGTSGNIDLKRIAANGLLCRTVSGYVLVDGAPCGNIELQARSGDILLKSTLPAEEYEWTMSSVIGNKTVNGSKSEIHHRENVQNHILAETIVGSIRLNFAKS